MWIIISRIAEKRAIIIAITLKSSNIGLIDKIAWLNAETKITIIKFVVNRAFKYSSDKQKYDLSHKIYRSKYILRAKKLK